jgi:hypothetical protein
VSQDIEFTIKSVNLYQIPATICYSNRGQIPRRIRFAPQILSYIATRPHDLQSKSVLGTICGATHRSNQTTRAFKVYCTLYVTGLEQTQVGELYTVRWYLLPYGC